MLRLLSPKKPNPPQSIAEAVALLSATPTSEYRSVLYNQLLCGKLRLAAREIPESWRDTVVVLKEATKVTLLTSDAPDGTTALLAFTSHTKVYERAPAASSFEMDSRAVLELVLAQEFGALVLDPNGPWAAIPRTDIEVLIGRSR